AKDTWCGPPTGWATMANRWPARWSRTPGRSRSKRAQSRLCAVEVLLRLAAGHAHRADDCAVALDEGRAQPGHGGKARQPIDHGKEGRPFLVQLRHGRAV